MVRLATYGMPALALWFFAWLWFELPWYLGPLPVVFAGIAGVLVWVERLANGPLPPLDRDPREATVTGHSTTVWDDENGSTRTNIHVRVETPDGAFDSVLADNFADCDRFELGSRWSVRTFTGTTARVLLAGHDDLPRTGYHLDGVRYPGEHRQWLRPKPGPLWRHPRFRQ